MSCRPRIAATTRTRLLHIVVSLAVLVPSALSFAVAPARAAHIDGISDQSLPAWDGSFAASPFAGFFRSRWTRAGAGQIAFARYVVQWDVMREPSGGAHPGGNYRERFEAWLEDVRGLGLIPVVALTSYDRVHPGSPAVYLESLAAILDRAEAMGYPVAYVEPWNEPNNQGGESAATAAAFANAANGLCEARRTCTVVAGDFEDRSDVEAYVQAYERALTFGPRIWGVHPYVSVQSHRSTNLRRLISALPAHGAGQQIWFTEIGALFCTRGEVRGEQRQASDAAYLVGALLADPALAPAHAFYYGFLFGGHASAPCAPSAGQDSELYASSGAERVAARVIFSRPGAAIAPPSGASPAPGAAAVWPPWDAAANLMIGPVPDSAGAS
ncbi:MAG TPA: hypothetical protein VGO14_00365 [Solirubrobacteraceae bacterium]|jgi:hypothetical protein|nr:hypothetical protein [Solirubrobacteraceae bacterium]